MTAQTLTSFDIIQSYGGRKVAEVLVEDVTAADTVLLTTYIATDIDITQVVCQNISDGSLVGCLVCQSTNNLTIGSGPSAEDLRLQVTYKSF